MRLAAADQYSDDPGFKLQCHLTWHFQQAGLALPGSHSKNHDIWHHVTTHIHRSKGARPPFFRQLHEKLATSTLLKFGDGCVVF